MNSKASSQRTLALPTIFTWAQWQDLLALREQYRQGRDLFSERERARLRFTQWLYQTGRLEP
jgi:hypothetical protein